MTYTITVWQVYLSNNSLLSTYETKQLAMSKAAEINERGINLAYVQEVKVYGGTIND